MNRGHVASDAFVARLWALCNVLRGDGISYNQYISELTYLLFLKLARETGSETLLPEGYRWSDLVDYSGENLIGYYQELLTHLGATASTELVRYIYSFPTTVFSHSENLAAVIQGIDALNWHLLDADAIGIVYEGLLAKNSEDSRSGAGQYFTPRALVDCMVECVQPALAEIIQDPSAGTGGFLISADHFIRSRYDAAHYDARPPTYEGMEIERSTHRLCLMNVFLNRMNAKIHLGDTLTSDASVLRPADVILANPPFGIRAGGQRLGREDLAHSSSNRQLQFVQHIYRTLLPGGRAAVVVPDNVLFEGGAARRVREELMEMSNLHMILRLPTGIFYAQNVSTHVLFFTRRAPIEPVCDDVWVYDLRTAMPRFGKRRQITAADFATFRRAYDGVMRGEGHIAEQEAGGRLKRFTSAQVGGKSEVLLNGWRKDVDEGIEDNEDPELVLQQMLSSLTWISRELKTVLEVLAAQEHGPNSTGDA